MILCDFCDYKSKRITTMRNNINKNRSANSINKKIKNRSVSPLSQIANQSSNVSSVKPKTILSNIRNDYQSKLKICLELADYHKKQNQELKIKNQVLQSRLQEQINDMQTMANELASIKATLDKNSTTNRQKTQSKSSRIECQKQQNNVQSLHNQISQLKAKIIELENQLLISNSSKHLTLANSQQILRPSRRLYNCGSSYCQSCMTLQEKLETQRHEYHNQLNQLTSELTQLTQQLNKLNKQSQVQCCPNQNRFPSFQQQITAKNKCIDYLKQQLDHYEQSHHEILSIMKLLQQKMEQLTVENETYKKSISFETFRSKA